MTYVCALIQQAVWSGHKIVIMQSKREERGGEGPTPIMYQPTTKHLPHSRKWFQDNFIGEGFFRQTNYEQLKFRFGKLGKSKRLNFYKVGTTLLSMQNLDFLEQDFSQ